MEGTMKMSESLLIALATGLAAKSAFAGPIAANAVLTSKADGSVFALGNRSSNVKTL
jgi:hypothetical protein